MLGIRRLASEETEWNISQLNLDFLKFHTKIIRTIATENWNRSLEGWRLVGEAKFESHRTPRMWGVDQYAFLRTRVTSPCKLSHERKWQESYHVVVWIFLTAVFRERKCTPYTPYRDAHGSGPKLPGLLELPDLSQISITYIYFWWWQTTELQCVLYKIFQWFVITKYI